MADTARRSAKYQISIPKAVREAQPWSTGQECVFIPKRQGVLVLPGAPGPKPIATAPIGPDAPCTSAWIEWLIDSDTGRAHSHGRDVAVAADRPTALELHFVHDAIVAPPPRAGS